MLSFLVHRMSQPLKHSSLPGAVRDHGQRASTSGGLDLPLNDLFHRAFLEHSLIEALNSLIRIRIRISGPITVEHCAVGYGSKTCRPLVWWFSSDTGLAAESRYGCEKEEDAIPNQTQRGLLRRAACGFWVVL